MSPPQPLPNNLQGPESHSTRVQLYWKDNILKLLKKLFRSMKNNMQHFFSSVTKKFKAASNQPPSSQHSTALTESLFLTLLHRKSSLLSSIYFHFYLKGRKELGFMYTRHELNFFCSALDCNCLPPYMNAYLNFHKKKITILPF